jgi:hypothetical protein
MSLGGILRLGVTTKLKFEGMANQVNQVNSVCVFLSAAWILQQL